MSEDTGRGWRLVVNSHTYRQWFFIGSALGAGAFTGACMVFAVGAIILSIGKALFS